MVFLPGGLILVPISFGRFKVSLAVFAKGQRSEVETGDSDLLLSWFLLLVAAFVRDNYFLANGVAAEVVLIRFGSWIFKGERGFVGDAVTNFTEVGLEMDGECFVEVSEVRGSREDGNEVNLFLSDFC